MQATGQRKRGVALVAVFLMLAIFASVAVLLAQLGTRNQRNARLEARSDEALYAAEAGLAVATERYLDDDDYEPEPTPEGFGGQGQTFRIALYRGGELSARGIAVPQNHVLIEATGYAASGQSRAVSALFTNREPTQAQDNAVLAGRNVRVEDGSVEVMPAAAAAAYAFLADTGSSLTPPEENSGLSTRGALLRTAKAIAPVGPGDILASDPQASLTDQMGIAHVAVESSAEGAITLGQEGSVDGKLRIPSGSQAQFTVDDDSGGRHGGVVDDYVPPALIPVRLPMVAGDLDITLTASSDPKSFSGSLKKAFKGGGELKPGAYRDVVVDGGVLELNTEDILDSAATGKAPKDLYVFKSLTLKNGGTVALRGKAKDIGLAAMVYIERDLSVVDGAIVNETLNPSFLQMYVSSGGEVRIDEEATSYNTLYAPGSDVSISRASLYGSVVGKSVSLQDGAHIYYDPSLATVRPDPWGNGGYYTVRKTYRRD
jgi:Tfp pilus assembly protein PilX